MVNELKFGAVKIIKGPHKNRIGLYDDDEKLTRGVVCFSGYGISEGYHLIPKKYLIEATELDMVKRDEKIRQEIHEINNNLREARHLNIILEERLRLISEAHFISQQLALRRLVWRNHSEHLREKISVFISYASPDKNFAKSLACDLEKIPFLEVWLDEWDIFGGHSIPSQLQDGSEQCEYMLLLLSKHSSLARWQKKEWETKLYEEINKEEVYLLPILIEECEVPQLLKSKKYLDFRCTEQNSKKYNNGIADILKSIRFHHREKRRIALPLG